MNELTLTPRHIASVSGGKDSLFMLKYIIEHPTEYPLDEVVYFDLEIDYPFIKDVITEIKQQCINLHIPFTAIKPRNSWYDLYDKYGYPDRKARWCNSQYKIDCRKQFESLQIQSGFKAIWYIGYCADETKRFNGKSRKPNEIYPLVDIGLNEGTILEWARKQTVYNNYYKVNDRCGCMGCPLAQYKEFAYLYKHYPDIYNDIINRMIETEDTKSEKLGRRFSIIQPNAKYDSRYLDKVVKEKYINIVNKLEMGDIL